MTNTPGFFGAGRPGLIPALPRGEEIAVYETYAAAQQAVDRLVQADFPVQAISIVGNEMKSVERVTGRLSWGRAAGAGAVTGLWLGLFLGLIGDLFLPNAKGGIGYLIGAVLIGAAFGILYGIVSYAITRRRRDFSSIMQVIASSYSLIADGEVANRARNLLGTSAVGLAAPVAAPPVVEEPPAGPTTPA